LSVPASRKRGHGIVNSRVRDVRGVRRVRDATFQSTGLAPFRLPLRQIYREGSTEARQTTAVSDWYLPILNLPNNNLRVMFL